MHSFLRARRCGRPSCVAFLVQAHPRFASTTRRLRAIPTGGFPPIGSASRSCRPSTGSSTRSASWSCAPCVTTPLPAGPSAPPCCGAASSPRWPRGCASSCACWSSPARRRPIRRVRLPDDRRAVLLASPECCSGNLGGTVVPGQRGCTGLPRWSSVYLYGAPPLCGGTFLESPWCIPGCISAWAA